jgi:hypothetical protein
LTRNNGGLTNWNGSFSNGNGGWTWFNQPKGIITRSWFGTFFIFYNIWDNPFHWLIFFKMVKTTNQFGIDDFEISCGYSNYETCQSPKKIDRWTCKEGFFMCPWGQEGFDMWSVSMVPMCKSPTKPWSKMATENTPFYSSHMLHVWNMYQHLP